MQGWLIRAGQGLHPINLSYYHGGNTSLPGTSATQMDSRSFDSEELR